MQKLTPSCQQTNIRSSLASVAVAALLLLGWAQPARALDCIQDRVGEPVNCTANDVRITDFSDIEVTDDGCAFVGDTVTFNAVLTVVTTATRRYDIGLFIGVDGRQALLGECLVRTLPTGPAPFRNFDNDVCGDTSSNATVQLPVTGLTVDCVDDNGDRRLDVANCTTWWQSSNFVCHGPSDVEPGTPAKCNCPEVPTDIDIPVPEPLCTDETCDDGQFCNGDEICDPQVGCLPGTPPNCNDDHECTADACDEATNTCTHTPNSLLCNDGEFCNGAEMCNPLLGCRPGIPPNCADSAACTVDSCDEATDSCKHTPNSLLCNDGLFCNGAEMCSALGCQAGSPPDCSDSVSCTIDGCNESTDSCTHSPNNALCTDGQFCNGMEICSPGAGCLPGTPIDCSDQFPCTIDTCNEATDSCARTPNDSLCSDGVFCNGSETCSPNAGCQGGTAPNCVDAVPCTIDSCNEAADRCDHLPDNSFCADPDICTDDTCLPGEGCVHTDNNAPCDDQNACTANERCAAGLCQPGESVCGDGDIDANCNEICDPGSSEICNNLVDDDGDGLIDCADPDCAETQLPGCDAMCMPIPPCAPLLNDPAIIYNVSGDGQRSTTPAGRFNFHARFVPYTDVDPIEDGFIVALTNAAGEIWRAEVAPGDLDRLDGKRYRLNRTIAASAESAGGITSMRIRKRRDQGLTGYGFRLRAIGDFGRATLPTMTTQVYFGDDTAFLTATWTKKPGRWTLHQRNYE